MLLRAAVILGVFLTTTIGFAQDIDVTIDPFTTRIFEEVPPDRVRTMAIEAPPPPFFAFVQGFGADGVRAGALSAGYAREGVEFPFRLRAQYSNFDPAQGEGFDSYTGEGRVKFSHKFGARNVSFAGQANYEVAPDRYNKHGIQFSTEVPFRGPIGFGATIGWAMKDPETGDSVDDFVTKVKIVTAAAGIQLEGEYTFENDVAKGDDDYFLAGATGLGRDFMLLLGVGKNDLFIVRVQRRFSFGR